MNFQTGVVLALPNPGCASVRRRGSAHDVSDVVLLGHLAPSQEAGRILGRINGADQLLVLEGLYTGSRSKNPRSFLWAFSVVPSFFEGI